MLHSATIVPLLIILNQITIKTQITKYDYVNIAFYNVKSNYDCLIFVPQNYLTSKIIIIEQLKKIMTDRDAREITLIN